MSQSSAALNSPNPMKKKVITALIAVAIGHIGVLWAVSHIKPAELKPIEINL
ncbi:TonB-dependent receptor, partial [Acinetobacter baumannii]